MRKNKSNPVQVTVYYQKSLSVMSHKEATQWLITLKERLEKKQAREQAYLARRAGRKIHTPTDEAYEQDQALENELLTLLDGLIDQFEKDKK